VKVVKQISFKKRIFPVELFSQHLLFSFKVIYGMTARIHNNPHLSLLPHISKGRRAETATATRLFFLSTSLIFSLITRSSAVALVSQIKRLLILNN